MVIIVTISLIRDMNNKIDMHLANGKTPLLRIIDEILFTQIKRLLIRAMLFQAIY